MGKNSTPPRPHILFIVHANLKIRLHSWVHPRSENPGYAYVNKQRDLYCVQVTTSSINWRQLRLIHCELIWLISTELLVTSSTATLTSLPLLRNTVWRLLELTQATPVWAWYFGFHRNALICQSKIYFVNTNTVTLRCVFPSFHSVHFNNNNNSHHHHHHHPCVNTVVEFNAAVLLQKTVLCG